MSQRIKLCTLRITVSFIAVIPKVTLVVRLNNKERVMTSSPRSISTMDFNG